MLWWPCGWRLPCAVLLLHASSVISISWVSQTAPNLAQTDLSMVHVMYATTPDGFQGLMHSMSSLVHHSSDPKQLTVDIVVPKENLAQMARLVECFKRDYFAPPIVMLHAMRPLPWNLSDIYTGYSFNRNSEFKADTVWARNYVQEYVPTAPRVIWLDVDTIVRDDLGQLYRMPMTQPVAAHPTKEYSNISTQFPKWKCTTDLGLEPGTQFKLFNTGVLLFDLAHWRSGDLSRRLAQISGMCRCSEQPALNLLLLDNYDRLSEEWNRDFGSTSAGSPHGRIMPGSDKILHWKGSLKPWRQPRMCNVAFLASISNKCLAPENIKLYSSYAPRQNCDVLH